MSNPISRQINIIHLSDIHFGDPHRFQPPRAPSGDRPDPTGFLSLLESLRADWENLEENGGPVIIAVTGDLTFKAAPKEFTEVKDFLKGIAQQSIMNFPIGKQNMFVVPGNHDVLYEEPDISTRWQPYCSFFQDFYKDSAGQVMSSRTLEADKPESLNRVHDRSTDLGLIVVELNSCLSVMKGSKDEHRGQINQAAIKSIRDQLKKIPEDNLKSSIRIALVHHHPILIPSFAEPNRGYDSILNASSLLNVLREFGFHVVLHGHKHYPHTFTYDASCAWVTDESGPMMVIAGGSTGSTELPQGKNAANTYNLLTIKWNWQANEARVHVQTRGLQIYKDSGEDLLVADWHWLKLREIDRLLRPRREISSVVVHEEKFDKQGEDGSFDAERKDQYAYLRLNMPVVEVIPSLHAKQEYEAQVWIAPHANTNGILRKEEDIPVEVIWSPGPKFEVIKCYPKENPDYRAKFAFYGPMLIQARIKFKDGVVVRGYVYAHMPGS